MTVGGTTWALEAMIVEEKALEQMGRWVQRTMSTAMNRHGTALR